MFDLQTRGRDIRLSRKSVPQLLAAAIIILTIDFFLWDLSFWTDRLSDAVLEPAGLMGAKFTGKLLGIIALGAAYSLLFITVSRKTFFEQTLHEYEAMTLTQKQESNRKGKPLIIIPFVCAILLLCYILLFRLD